MISATISATLNFKGIIDTGASSATANSTSQCGQTKSNKVNTSGGEPGTKPELCLKKKNNLDTFWLCSGASMKFTALCDSSPALCNKYQSTFFFKVKSHKSRNSRKYKKGRTFSKT